MSSFEASMEKAISPLGKALNSFGHKFSPYVMEFLGTMFLVMTIGLAGNGAGPLAPLAIGAGLMVWVFLGGHISGAHYNPAVSVGVLLAGRGKITLPKVIAYIIVQLFGGFIGALIANGIEHASPLHPKEGFSDGNAFSVEVLYTFALVTVVLNVATTDATAGNSFFGLGIGFTVMSAAFSAGPVSGGCFNPAVGFGLSIVNKYYGEVDTGLGDLWLYILAPLLGGVLAATIFRITNPNEYDDTPEEKRSEYYPMES